MGTRRERPPPRRLDRTRRTQSGHGSYSFDYLGQCDVALQESLVYSAGRSYQRTASTLHMASSESDSPTVTLFIQGAAQQAATTVIGARFQFSHSGASADIIDDDDRMLVLLAELGCIGRLGELRSKRDARFAELGERISAAGFAEGALF